MLVDQGRAESLSVHLPQGPQDCFVSGYNGLPKLVVESHRGTRRHATKVVRRWGRIGETHLDVPAFAGIVICSRKPCRYEGGCKQLEHQARVAGS